MSITSLTQISKGTFPEGAALPEELETDSFLQVLYSSFCGCLATVGVHSYEDKYIHEHLKYVSDEYNIGIRHGYL